ncbi:uncharacterized [Tachysurus ichikawai]
MFHHLTPCGTSSPPVAPPHPLWHHLTPMVPPPHTPWHHHLTPHGTTTSHPMAPPHPCGTTSPPISPPQRLNLLFLFSVTETIICSSTMFSSFLHTSIMLELI